MTLRITNDTGMSNDTKAIHVETGTELIPGLGIINATIQVRTDHFSIASMEMEAPRFDLNAGRAEFTMFYPGEDEVKPVAMVIWEDGTRANYSALAAIVAAPGGVEVPWSQLQPDTMRAALKGDAEAVELVAIFRESHRKLSGENEPLPDWATGRAVDGYMTLGAQLPTKDGRKIGNAHVVGLGRMAKTNEPIASILTDAGNTVTFTAREMAEHFHPPEFVSDVDETKRKFALKDTAGDR